MPDAIQIRAAVISEITSLAAREPRSEICGLLAGHGGVITRAFPGSNAASNTATAYEIAPAELFRLMRAIRAAGLELLGIYHSHPNGMAEPSPADIDRAYYPDAAYFVLSPLPHAPHPIRAFAIRNGRATELLFDSVE